VPSPTSKPFYFQPPLNVLFEFHKLKKIRPWAVNISFLLTSLLKEMEKRGEVDFRASGMALDSSSTIYLMKSKLLLKLEEPPAPAKPPPGFLPPPLFLPLRYELTSTTIQHLLKALDEVLTGERLLALRPRVEPVLPPPPEFIPPVDLYLMEIEKMMDELYSSILRFAGEGRLVIFSKFATGMKKLEAVKTFITLLFLAQTGKVSLWQEEDFSDIYITLREGPPIDG
jgi:segregation and condensation protein A